MPAAIGDWENVIFTSGECDTRRARESRTNHPLATTVTEVIRADRGMPMPCHAMHVVRIMCIALRSTGLPRNYWSLGEQRSVESLKPRLFAAASSFAVPGQQFSSRSTGPAGVWWLNRKCR